MPRRGRRRSRSRDEQEKSVMSEEKEEKAEEQTGEDAGEKPPQFSSGFAARRHMLQVGFGAMCCLGGAQVVWPLFRYMTAAEGGEAEPVPVPKSQVPVGAMVKVLWGRIPCYMVNDGGTVYCLSRVCTHLGCLVDWNEEKGQFYCPCHEGYFDKQGNVTAGPPPRALDRIPFTTTETSYIIGIEPEEGAEDKKA